MLLDTKDLIDELRKEAKGKVLVAIVAVFPDVPPQFVFSSSTTPLAELNALVKAGGKPIGFMALVPSETETGVNYTLTNRPIKGLDWPSVRDILDGLTEQNARALNMGNN
jgi:hypothetical protein